MVDERDAYSESSYFSEQLSCIKYFHPSYGLFYINFQSLKHTLKIILIIKFNRKGIMISPRGQSDLSSQL